MPLWVRAEMLSSDWDAVDSEWGSLEGLEGGGVRVMYMNVGRGVEATHEYLERCARGDVAVAFVGECWVERLSDRGTQSHQHFVRLGSVSGGAKVACHVRRDLVDFCSLVCCANRFVCVELGGVRFGGVYSKCGSRVHEMSSWLEEILRGMGDRRWILVGDWNAHHTSWSLDGKSDPVGRVLEEWRQERGARLLRGRGHTFERRRGGDVVVSRIDFALAGGGVERGGLSAGWGLSDHSVVGCVGAVDDLVDVVGHRDAVDWLRVQVTVDGEEEDWYGSLAGETAYERLADFRRRHLRKIRIGGRSKRWWDSELSVQVKVVRRERRGWRRVGHRNVLRAQIAKMKRMVKEKKAGCWRAFCEDSGLQSPWEVVRWARDPCRERERMGWLRGADGVWVDSDEGG